MATLTAVNRKTQNAKALRGEIEYVEQETKTRWGDARFVTGYNCVPQSAFTEMQMTKQRFRKTGGTQFYHFVQSFSDEDNVTLQEVNAVGLEFAQRQFPDFEVVVATHVDTGHLHNHLVVNSVSCKDGHKLHQSRSDLIQHRNLSDSWTKRTGTARCAGNRTESTSRSSVPMAASVGTAVSTMKHSSRKIWRSCSSTVRPRFPSLHSRTG